MKEADYPSGVLGYAAKIVAFDKAERGGRVQKKAYELFEKRKEQNLPGSADDDWKNAEEIVVKSLVSEIVGQKLAKINPV